MGEYSSIEKNVTNTTPKLIAKAGTASQLSSLGLDIVNLVNSGALTADTYSELLSYSGSGTIQFLSLRALDTTARTITLKLVLDGVTVFEVGKACTATSHGVQAIGAYAYSAGTYLNISFENVPFNSSMSVSVKSTLSETDKSQLAYAYIQVR